MLLDISIVYMHSADTIRYNIITIHLSFRWLNY